MCNIEEWDASDGNSAITVAYGMAWQHESSFLHDDHPQKATGIELLTL